MKNYDVLNELVPKTQELHRSIFDKGYGQGFNEGQARQLASDDVFRESCEKSAYEKGLNDAWGCARKICKMDYETRREALGVDDEHDLLGKIFNIFSASETIAKIKEYEEKAKQADDEIKVGDEVYLSSLSKDYPRIVLSLYAEDDGLGLKARTILSGGIIDIKPVSELKRTGRHFDQISEVLKQLKEGGK